MGTEGALTGHSPAIALVSASCKYEKLQHCQPARSREAQVINDHHTLKIPVEEAVKVLITTGRTGF